MGGRENILGMHERGLSNEQSDILSLSVKTYCKMGAPDVTPVIGDRVTISSVTSKVISSLCP
jgi:hypothetical protein